MSSSQLASMPRLRIWLRPTLAGERGVSAIGCARPSPAGRVQECQLPVLAMHCLLKASCCRSTAQQVTSQGRWPQHRQVHMHMHKGEGESEREGLGPPGGYLSSSICKRGVGGALGVGSGGSDGPSRLHAGKLPSAPVSQVLAVKQHGWLW